MPYPNEHACRIKQPVKGAEMKRVNGERNHKGKSYDVIYQKNAKGAMEEQAYRYPVGSWDAAAAESHCDSHSGLSFEKAAGEAKGSEYEIDAKELELLEEDPEGTIKSTIMMFPRRKKLRHPFYGELAFDDAFFDQVISNFEQKVLGNTVPFIDQDHDERGAAGWIVGLKKAKKGLYGDVEWTDIGVDLIKRKIYRYFSPSYGPYENPETGKKYDNVLRGGGLTNVPFLKMMPPIEFEQKQVLVKLSEYYSDETTNNGGSKMDLEGLRKLLNVEKDEEIEPKIKILLSQIDTLTTRVTELEKTKEGAEEDDEAKKKLTEALDSNKKLAVKIRNMERDKAIGKALSEGRMLPEKKKFYEDLYEQAPEVVEKAIAEMPVVINLSGPKGHQGDPQEPKATAEEIEAAKSWSLSKEDLEKYGE